MRRSTRASTRGSWCIATVPSKPPVFDERTAIALLAEAEVLERQQDRDGERVVHLEHVDVLDGDPGALHRKGARLRGGSHGQVGHLADVRVVRQRVRRTK